MNGLNAFDCKEMRNTILDALSTVHSNAKDWIDFVHL